MFLGKEQNFQVLSLFFLMHLILDYECKYVHNNLVLISSTFFIATTSFGREFHILITDGKNE